MKKHLPVLMLGASLAIDCQAQSFGDLLRSAAASGQQSDQDGRGQTGEGRWAHDDGGRFKALIVGTCARADVEDLSERRPDLVVRCSGSSSDCIYEHMRDGLLCILMWPPAA
jgi:hypothetical protein